MDETSIPLPPTPAEGDNVSNSAVHAPVDWSYDTVSDAPNFLSFEAGASSAVQQPTNYYANSYARGYNKGGWQQQPRGHYNRGGYYNQGPANQYYGYNQYRAPRGSYYRPQQQTYYQQPYMQQNRWQQPNYNYNYNNRGWNRGGYTMQRGRGGYGYGQYQNPRDAPISAFFHPSMLEDPWAALEAAAAVKPTPETASEEATTEAPAASSVSVADDDPELLDLFSQLKGNKAADDQPEEEANMDQSVEATSVTAQPETREGDDQLGMLSEAQNDTQPTTAADDTESTITA
ncbi:uncharacterized protein LOC129581948 [Paramacrobiotus metropolitanus]|uniref:uncharacterized protein LOC129581948 n=1 Tax=Paramacrobiotus metropolitanus TaxID=2943436 RepID=UPI002445F516|nr:uncharacterized protein LOC129581948 [Paramacrobiotus metropolitanus]